MVNRLNREMLLGYEPKEKLSFIDVLLIVVMVLLIVNIFVQSVWLSPVKVDGTSMNNTLEHEDWLFMDKIKQPKRGDVVVFKISETVNYIKRIIALPGDSVRTVKGKVQIKIGKDGEWKEISEPYAYFEPEKVEGTYLLKKIEGVVRMVDIPETEIKEGEMFVLGDNRWGSRDSREIGVVKTENILGIVPRWAIDKKEKYGPYLDYIEQVNKKIRERFGENN